MANVPPPAGVDPALWSGLLALAQAFATVQRPAADGSAAATPGGDSRPVIKSSEDIGYFDPDYEDPSGKDSSIVTSGRHSFYRDVYVFTDRLKDLEKGSSGAKIKEYISGCLKGGALRWQARELTELERDFLREATIERWCTTLIRRFKERGPVALKALQTERYTYADARSGRTPRAYVQEILRHARAAEYDSVYHQLLTA